MEGRGIAGASVRPLFHDQFARIALVRLEALVAHRGPTVAAIEEVADADVEWIARRSHHRGRRGPRSRALRSALPSRCGAGASHRSGRHHTRLPDAFAVS